MSDLATALTRLDAGIEVGFAQSPTRSGFVRRTADRLVMHDGSDVDLSWVFDLRLFNADAEFHWWWDQRSGQGREHVLDDAAGQGYGWSRLGDGFPRRILRGTAGQIKVGWTRLHDGHSQPLWIPFVATKPGTRVALGAVEYTRADDHGNIGVVAERLTTFKELS